MKSLHILKIKGRTMMLTFETGMDMFVWAIGMDKPDEKLEDAFARHSLLIGPLNMQNGDANYYLEGDDRDKLEKYAGAIVHEVYDEGVTVDYFEDKDAMTTAWETLKSDVIDKLEYVTQTVVGG
jgi:hypothetical protein